MNKLFTPILLAILFCISACGSSGDNSPQQADAPQTKIINGVEVSQTDAPQYVKVIMKTWDGQYGGCTGTMIGAQAVLTAAHCVTGAEWVAVQTDGDEGPVFFAAAVYVAEGYSSNPFTGPYNDLAVVITEQPTGRPALPLLASTSPVPGSNIMVVGFGVEDGVNGSYGILRTGTMIVSEVTSYHIITEYDGSTSNVCFGDSGGPAVYFAKDLVGNTTAVGVAGIVSAGTDPACAPGDTTYFTNIEGFISGILAIVPDAVLS